ncbi:activin receptor type-1 [Nematostella vectensis]|uniref:activin receptor type-1 n=1 Tax=Nematostella vectensis TaxID=45351 RepID=UPI0020778404|nr:activin receptor type-1 [Nematostella vectensis]
MKKKCNARFCGSNVLRKRVECNPRQIPAAIGCSLSGIGSRLRGDEGVGREGDELTAATKDKTRLKFVEMPPSFAITLVIFTSCTIPKCVGGVNITQPNRTSVNVYRCICSDCRSNAREQTCSTETGCFSSLFLLENGQSSVTKGCLKDADHYNMMCRGPRGKPNLHDTRCCTHDLCNKHINPTHAPSTIPPIKQEKLDVQFLIISICAPVAALIVCLIIVYMIFRHLMKHHAHHQSVPRHELGPVSHVQCPCNEERPLIQDLIDISSGSGSGLPLLVQRTVARETQLIESIGKGRYGEVWKGVYQGESVAIKIFSTTDEASWKRETEIYNTVMLRHDNILGFIAADVHSRKSTTYMWLIMHYHEQGSLYDFLNRSTFDAETLCRLALSAASGLAHLHTEIFGTNRTGSKPAIAHRDIKSKNILVKSNYTCAVGDLGLAVMYSQDKDSVDMGENPKIAVGTRRYMAPEILEETINAKCINSFKRADVYAFGLVLWEIARRYVSGGIVEEYQPPFYDMVQSDPSIDEMKKVVVTENKRPSLPNRWTGDPTLQVMSKLIRECWNPNPAARLTSLRIKKSLLKLMDSLKPRNNCLNRTPLITEVSDVNIHLESMESEESRSLVKI